MENFGKSTILRRNALSTTQILTRWVQKVYRDMARDQPIFQFWKVGKSTILQRNALSIPQIVTKWVQKVYRDMARNPPIFQFWEVGKSTNLQRLRSLQIYVNMTADPTYF